MLINYSDRRVSFTSLQLPDIRIAMKRRHSLKQWGLCSLRMKFGFLEGEFVPRDADGAAAWELYSVDAIFPLTREILRRQGSGGGEFAKLGIPVLNQIIRLFTVKW